MTTEIDAYVGEYGRKLSSFCIALCKNRNDAQDLYQETWVRAIRYFSSYKKDRPFENWIYQICVNVFRIQRRRQSIPTVSVDEYPDFSPAPQPADQSAEFSADYFALKHAIAALPLNLTAVLVLCCQQGYTASETGKILRIPAGTVKSRLHKARTILQKELDLHGK